MKFKKMIQRYIETHRLLSVQDKVWVALSGGADSVALLRVLMELGYSCQAAHCNFQLRGEESDRDEAFVQKLCESFFIPLQVIKFDTEDYAKSNRISIEMAARELRYDWFSKLCSQEQGSKMAVAHHRDDSVETLLLNLIRGTGINGLKGISCMNGNIVRPLLEVTREDILEYLKEIGQDYVTDSTNLEDEYQRNKIRLNLLPLMKELNPSVSESLWETMKRLSEVEKIYRKDRERRLAEAVHHPSSDEQRMEIQKIWQDVSPQTLLYEWLYPLGFNSSQIADIFQSVQTEQSGKRFFSAEWELLRDRSLLLVHRLEQASHLPEVEVSILERTDTFVIQTDKNVACLDADKVTLPLEVRQWEEGDSFVPLGMKGKKNVCKYMTDRKFSLFQKERQYVLVSEGKIVWLMGERIDHRFRVTEDTRRILFIRLKE